MLSFRRQEEGVPKASLWGNPPGTGGCTQGISRHSPPVVDRFPRNDSESL